MCSNLPVPFSVIREYYHKALELLQLLTCSAHWPWFLESYYTLVFLVFNFYSSLVARSWRYAKCWGVKIWSVVLQPRQKPHWVSSSFGLIISRHHFQALGIRFFRELRRKMPPKLVHSLMSLFLCVGLITRVCQSFGAIPDRHATWCTRISQRTPRFTFLSISGRISSQPAAFRRAICNCWNPRDISRAPRTASVLGLLSSPVTSPERKRVWKWMKQTNIFYSGNTHRTQKTALGLKKLLAIEKANSLLKGSVTTVNHFSFHLPL